MKLFKKKNWQYFNKVIPERWDYDDVYYKYRFCKNSGKLQEFYTHCFGLNPPSYTGEWITLKGKPYFKYDSVQQVWVIFNVKFKGD